MVNAVIYARFSSHNQTEQSIEGQVRVCTAYAEAHGMIVTRVYADRAISGKTDLRPEFQRMIHDASKHEFEALIVYRTDRFARNKYDSAVYKQQLKKAGVTIHYAAEAIPQGPEGIILESLLEGLAEYYSAELSQKIKRGIRESAEKGNASGGPPPFGYDLIDKKYVVNEREARGVRLIFDLYNKGVPQSEIIKTLNVQGYRTKRGAKFQKSSLDRMLKNKKYVGEFRLMDVVIDGGVPAIISNAAFTAAQNETERRRTSKRERTHTVKYLLLDKLFCGVCGSRMVGVSGRGRSGAAFGYYYCSNHRGKNKTCEVKQVRSDLLEQVVVEATLRYILNEDRVAAIARKCYELQLAETPESTVAYYNAEIAKTHRAAQNLVTAIEQGAPNAVLLAERIAELEETERALIRAQREETAHRFIVTEEQIKALLGRYIDAPAEEIINTFVARVELTNEWITIYYNLTGKDGGLQWERLNSDAKGPPPAAHGKPLTLTASGAVLKIKRTLP